MGGNIYDAVSLAVKAALTDTLVPHVRSVTVDGNNVDMDVCDELYDCDRLNVVGAPVMVCRTVERKNVCINLHGSSSYKSGVCGEHFFDANTTILLHLLVR